MSSVGSDEHTTTNEGKDTFDSTGDYSARLEELLDEEEDVSHNDEEGSDSEGGFIYTGQDAPDESANYRDRMRDILDEELEAEETQEVEITLNHFSEDEILPDTNSPPHTDTTPSISTPPRVDSPALSPYSKLARPYLHPTVSRLRSYTPQASPAPSSGISHNLFDGTSPSPSHFSAVSRTSSVSNLRVTGLGLPRRTSNDIPSRPKRDVFRWVQLHHIVNDVYPKNAPKAASVLGKPTLGAPTTLAANGMICIGTDEGKICVYDFKQTLKCVCSANDTSSSSKTNIGPVTALALSHDHTYVASGHASGHIQLFDLNSPATPARSVPPTTITAVASGRKEGHIRGSRIVNIGFIAGRHTAIVSADENGMAFYHSLGKVLFVEAADILRILGKYPVEETQNLVPKIIPRRNNHRSSRYKILAMMPLPLGTTPHPTDSYNIVALLTPTKLVVVGLKPSPKTWFKSPQESTENTKSKWRGTMAWFPSVAADQAPTLAYSWGSTLHLIKVSEQKTKQEVKNTRTGKIMEIETGNITFEQVSKWSMQNDILSLQWLNVNQLVVLSSTTLEVYDVHISQVVERVRFDGLSLVSPSMSSTVSGSVPYAEAVANVAHSMRVYKGKIFVLGREQLQVATLLTWADRILAFVDAGDFLSAIDLTRSYYVGDAPGNRNGLPDDLVGRKTIVGEKMRELMAASVKYTFSEERMSDGTHVTPDGRGVDRTALFENLVVTCAKACVVLDDCEFLFEDLFQQYDDNGIAQIFLVQLETFVLNSSIPVVPPRITQRLVGMHEQNNRPDLAERVIWHIDPACLDINQAINLCQKHHLYDALIYVYTRALRDYVAPIVQLLELIRKVQQYRKAQLTNGVVEDESVIEPVFLNAYKIYPYLANVLSGLTYPSEQPLDHEEATQAKDDIYEFLFFGRSSVWPKKDPGGKLVLTSDEEGGVEPTYPYARLLLRFDAEAFLHSLDIAFEDSYLNDYDDEPALNNKPRSINRLIVVRVLLEILSSGDLPSADATFVNIFIAKNVPKYPLSLTIAPTALHGVLLGLAEEPDPSTREDRQLAAEYLLSAYSPHDSEHIIELFETAGFYRILRSMYRRERQWEPLLSTYLHDPDLRPVEIFDGVEDVLRVSKRGNHGVLPAELLDSISNALSRLLQANLASTAVLLDKHAPELHAKALDDIGKGADHQRYIYLRHLLGPKKSSDEEYHTASPPKIPSLNVGLPLRQLYIDLQCQYHPVDVVSVLQSFPEEFVDWPEVIETCEKHHVYDAVVWATNTHVDPRDALSKAASFEKQLSLGIVNALSGEQKMSFDNISLVKADVDALEAVGRVGIKICLDRSQGVSATEIPLEDVWFQLLNSQIQCVQNVSGSCSAETLAREDNPLLLQSDDLVDVEWYALSTLRTLVQDTFSALVSISSTRAVSFPRLFKRLVNPTDASITGTQYTEFRTILTGMLESYRSDGDMLIITKHLVDRDLFETIAEVKKEREIGWRPSTSSSANCPYCGKALLVPKREGEDAEATNDRIVISRTGSVYHMRCQPPTLA